jgi:hypothetical protein
VTGRVFAPKEARAGDAFLVRAWWPFETSVQLYADGTWLLGTMGWNRYCGCKELAVLLGTPGARRLAASIDGVVVETVVVEVR